MSKTRLDYIDALRGIAALMVLVCHSLQMDGGLQLPQGLFNAVEALRYGVQLFFVISALTIFYSLRHSDANSTNFFIRRFFRIAPLYLLAIVGYSMLQSFSPVGALLNALFLHGFSPRYINSIVPAGWSIGVEMAFYCAVPLLFRYIRNLYSALHFLFLSILFAFALLYLYRKFLPSTPMAESFMHFYLPNQLPVFALGFVTYFLVFEKQRVDVNKLMQPLLALSLLVAFCVVSHMAVFGEHFLFALSCVGLIVVLANRRLPLLVNRPTLFLGKVSYSLYLGQYAGIILLSRWGVISPFNNAVAGAPYLNWGFNLLLLLSFNLLLAIVLYHTVEQPFQRLARQIIGKRMAYRQGRTVIQRVSPEPAASYVAKATLP